MKSSCIDLLKRYCAKQEIHLAQRGNKAIQVALRIAKSMGKTKALIQDQGGWLTYQQYPTQLKLKEVILPTQDGLVEPNTLSQYLDDETVVLMNSLSGYFVEQPMALIASMTKQKNALLINDASGSIGSDQAHFGDIIIGSFGENKPVNVEYGGFLALSSLSFDKSLLESLVFEDQYAQALLRQLEILPKKLERWNQKRKQVLADLEDYEVIHADKQGINVIVAFSSAVEKQKIINYCSRNMLEFTECPRYIRVNRDAISIEIKRLQ